MDTTQSGGYSSQSDVTQSSSVNRSASAKLEIHLFQRLLQELGKPPFKVSLWNGQVIHSPQQPVAHLTVRKPGILRKVVFNPVLHFGDAYSNGEVEVEGDLVKFLEHAYRAGAKLDSAGTFKQRILPLLHRRKNNSLSGSRENIHHHYDIGNDFYRLWLDQRMLYTCAYFPNPELSLEDAQLAKMHHVCRKVLLRPGESVVEAGCGWGALALHMARHYGVKVKAFNISHEQIIYAREQARIEGLEQQIEFIEDDYRNITGRFDAFVSVGMLEHVGTDHYRELGNVISRVLPKHGRGLIHSIGRNRPAAMNAWIEKRIFPGAHPPSLSEMSSIFEPNSLSILDVENLRLHYSKTLQHWLTRFEENKERVKTMFDEKFVRMWRLYLSGSIASFNIGELQLFQAVFAPHDNNDLPWSREHLYRAG